MNKIISFNSNIPEANYERIFGKKRKDIKIEYQRNPSGDFVSNKASVTLINDDGKKIDRVTVYHKNKIYRQAKELRENLRESMCTKSECWKPNKENVGKMIREMRNPKVIAYKMAMKAIGAEPRDCEPERLRRGR